ncbi:putative rhamnosyl transferase [Cribrihabitans neustonicus]|uniref:putative rhamnosyl transferase n=1 Tax=Cribrihabitans neustonicus TaxID=1429085 RepID=UPI003B5A3690
MQVIGLCRFSYPAIGGFQIKHASIEERTAYLYSTARLAERFRLFETVALPSLRAQTDPNFELIVVTGDSLPAEHRDRLHALTADMPQVRILAEPPGQHRPVMKRILNAARREPAEPCLQFRHDDDDAISVDFIERLRQTARDCEGLLHQHKSVAIDFNRGFLAELGPQGISAMPIFRPYYTAALGMYVRGGCALTIMNFAHEKIPQFMPTVTFSDAPMFVRTQNAFNDSPPKSAGGARPEPLSADLEGEFEARFDLRAEAVRTAFAPG